MRYDIKAHAIEGTPAEIRSYIAMWSGQRGGEAKAVKRKYRKAVKHSREFLAKRGKLLDCRHGCGQQCASPQGRSSHERLTHGSVFGGNVR